MCVYCTSSFYCHCPVYKLFVRNRGTSDISRGSNLNRKAQHLKMPSVESRTQQFPIYMTTGDSTSWVFINVENSQVNEQKEPNWDRKWQTIFGTGLLFLFQIRKDESASRRSSYSHFLKNIILTVGGVEVHVVGNMRGGKFWKISDRGCLAHLPPPPTIYMEITPLAFNKR